MYAHLYHEPIVFYIDILYLGGGICEKYQSRDEKYSEPKGEGSLVSRLAFFANTPKTALIIAILSVKVLGI
jgi:hypothetical protein